MAVRRSIVPTPELRISEKQLQKLIEEALTLQGWLWFHDRSLAYASTKANNPGFPDICAVHPYTGVVVFLELKSATGKLRPAQMLWGDALERASDVLYAVVRPADADRVIARLADLANPDVSA